MFIVKSKGIDGGYHIRLRYERRNKKKLFPQFQYQHEFRTMVSRTEEKSRFMRSIEKEAQMKGLTKVCIGRGIK